MRDLTDYVNICIDVIHSTDMCVNPNWHETGRIYPPYNFWIVFCQMNFYQKISNIFGGKNWDQNLLLGCPKDEHFSYFHSSCKLGLMQIFPRTNEFKLFDVVWGFDSHLPLHCGSETTPLPALIQGHKYLHKELNYINFLFICTSCSALFSIYCAKIQGCILGFIGGVLKLLNEKDWLSKYLQE